MRDQNAGLGKRESEEIHYWKTSSPGVDDKYGHELTNAKNVLNTKTMWRCVVYMYRHILL